MHTREKAGLFDVSHMGQAILAGAGAARLLETLTPADLIELAPERTRYTQLLDNSGGILDDLMATRLPGRDERLFLVVNAATKAQDFALIARKLPQLALHVQGTRAMLALQGPRAVDALKVLLPGVEELSFMEWRAFDYDGAGIYVTRSGYTGEDGFEISLPAVITEGFALRLLDHPDVAPIGLGARDSLRLEAGLCLYGHDIDATTDPVEAGLVFSIGKRRRDRGRLSRIRADSRGAGSGAGAAARRPRAARQGAGARGRADPRQRRAAGRARHLGRLFAKPRAAHRHGLRRTRARGARGRR